MFFWGAEGIINIIFFPHRNYTCLVVYKESLNPGTCYGDYSEKCQRGYWRQLAHIYVIICDSVGLRSKEVGWVLVECVGIYCNFIPD